jgi:hypothetical protein
MADPLSAEVFPKVLVRYVPEAAVRTALDAILPSDISGEQRKDFIERLQPDALNDLPRQMEALTAELITRQLLTKFAATLLRSLPTDVRLQGILAKNIAIDTDGNLNEGQLQSLRRRRSPFVNCKTFGDFIVAVRHRICAIWIKSPNARTGAFKGTGFLIAPDLLMTAYHVRADALQTVLDDAAGDGAIVTKDQEVPGATVKCVFDYWMSIAADALEGAPPAGMTVVDAAATNWLVWCRRNRPSDGISHEFGYDPDVRERLDCAIIRLTKPIGAEAFETGGGRMRGWIKLPVAPFDRVAKYDPIAILQHPEGGMSLPRCRAAARCH